MKEIKLKIRRNGEVTVNQRVADARPCVRAQYDLKSKRAQILSWHSDSPSPCLTLFADECTLHTNPDKEGCCTEVFFPEMKGWEIVHAECGRYTLTVFFAEKAP